MKNLWVILIFLGFSFSASAKGPTLSEYLQQVQNANPNIQAAQAAAQRAEFQVRPAGTWDDPFIAAGIDEVPFEGGTEMGYVKRYQISQTIPFPGKSSSRMRVANHQAEAAKTDVETVSRQLKILATQVYFKVFLNQRSLELNRDLHQILQTISDSARARYKAGSSGHHEWLLSQVEANILEVERLRIERDQKSLSAVFNELRNQPVETPVESLAFKYQAPDVEKLQSMKLEDQPEIRSLDFSLHQAQEEEHLAKLSYFPDIVLQGMMMEPSPEMMDQQRNWGVMIGVSVPLYFWRKQNDLLQAATSQKRQAEFERQVLLNRVSSEWLQAQEQLKSSVDVVKLYQNSVLPATRLAADDAKIGYSARRTTLDEYLNALKIQRTQELELTAAQMDVQLAELRMKEVLSNPPLIRLSPARPSLFGTEGMAGSGMNQGMDSSGTVNMGTGMSGPTRKAKPQGTTSPGGSGMEGM